MALSVAEKGRKDEPMVNEGNIVQQQEQQQPVVEQPVVENKPKYKFGWGKDGATFGSVIRGEAKDIPIEQVLPDYLQWARDNDVPVDYVSLYSTMKDRDTSKSYNENEKEKKNKQMEDMFQGLGNVLVSFANLGGVAAGAPAPTNTESPAELSERQRRLREETLKRYNGYNSRLFELMKQQQADEYKRENLRIMEEYKRALAEASKTRADSQAAQGEAKVRYWDAKTGQIVEMTPAQIKKIEEQIKTEQGKRGVQGSQINVNNARAEKIRHDQQGNGKKSLPGSTGGKKRLPGQ